MKKASMLKRVASPKREADRRLLKVKKEKDLFHYPTQNMRLGEWLNRQNKPDFHYPWNDNWLVYRRWIRDRFRLKKFIGEWKPSFNPEYRYLSCPQCDFQINVTDLEAMQLKRVPNYCENCGAHNYDGLVIEEGVSDDCKE